LFRKTWRESLGWCGHILLIWILHGVWGHRMVNVGMRRSSGKLLNAATSFLF
jgi:hypothetical protein